MDFASDAETEAFRREVRAFLAEHLPPEIGRASCRERV